MKTTKPKSLKFLRLVVQLPVSKHNRKQIDSLHDVALALRVQGPYAAIKLEEIVTLKLSTTKAPTP